MTKKERYEKVIAWFQENVPVAETELHYNNPYELLIAVILSAQCTDKRVNMITPRIYQDFPTPEALAATTPEVIFEYIRSVSYPNNKAEASGGHGTHAGERLQQRSSRHAGRTGEVARRRAQNGQCHPVRRVQQGCHGGRHPRLPREPPHRTGRCEFHAPPRSVLKRS